MQKHFHELNVEKKTSDLEFGARMKWGNFSLSYYNSYEKNLHLDTSPLYSRTGKIQISSPKTERLMFDWESPLTILPII